jgi:hypothetical protein
MGRPRKDRGAAHLNPGGGHSRSKGPEAETKDLTESLRAGVEQVGDRGRLDSGWGHQPSLNDCPPCPPYSLSWVPMAVMTK